MVLFPEAQKLAQKELDEVVGDNRLPDINDLKSLPYIRATVKESLRCK
jgi:cytochrome P450